MNATKNHEGNIVVADDEGHHLVYRLQDLRDNLLVASPDAIVNGKDLNPVQEMAFIIESHTVAMSYARAQGLI